LKFEVIVGFSFPEIAREALDFVFQPFRPAGPFLVASLSSASLGYSRFRLFSFCFGLMNFNLEWCEANAPLPLLRWACGDLLFERTSLEDLLPEVDAALLAVRLDLDLVGQPML
tara:strand:- start:24 stop:365 length:342 start_codon:yes stop_codon:yes gene_type:complete